MDRETIVTTAVEKAIEAVPKEGIDTFMDNLNMALTTITAKLVEVAPEAANLVLGVVQAKGIFMLVVGALVMSAVIFALLKWIKFAKNVLIPFDIEDRNGYMATTLSSLAVGLVLAITAGVGLGILFDFYMWLSAVSPEAALAYTALQAAGINL